METCRKLSHKVGENIYFYRKENNISQFKLANRSGLSQAYIGRLEHGQINATIETLEKVAGALSVTVAELFDRTLYFQRAEDETVDKIAYLMEYQERLKFLYPDAQRIIFAMIDLLFDWQHYVPNRRKKKNRL